MPQFTRQNWLVFAIVAIPALLLIVVTDGCTDAAGARQTLARAGYMPLEVGGRGWFRGHRGEWYVTKFTALTPRGDTVRGVVRRGFFQKGDIRTYLP